MEPIAGTKRPWSMSAPMPFICIIEIHVRFQPSSIVG
jgi:hypothetical protein